MPIAVTCGCGKTISVPAEKAGRRGKCRACGAALQVPDIEDEVADAFRGIMLDDSGEHEAAAPPPEIPAAAPVPEATPVVAAPARSKYEYGMVQVPPSIDVREGQMRGRAAALYLHEVVNSMAAKGWDFYRIDSMGVSESPGCLAALFGVGATTTLYHVITFRREWATAGASNSDSS
jgi:hypothetical protein